NPRYCHKCFSVLEATNGGAEIECSLLFADVRGSTTLAEQMPATEFRHLLDRFYRVTTEVLIAQDGIIDKFVGDEVVAIFIPALRPGTPGRASRGAGLRGGGSAQPGRDSAPAGRSSNTGWRSAASSGSDVISGATRPRKIRPKRRPYQGKRAMYAGSSSR